MGDRLRTAPHIGRGQRLENGMWIGRFTYYAVFVSRGEVMAVVSPTYCDEETGK